jgi:predicted transport protein
VINQGLYYLDWLLDHKAEFRWLVMERLGKDAADRIGWSGTRLLCIASDFTKYDEHAVSQINRNIELIRYRLFDKDLLLLELVNAVTGETPAVATDETKAATTHKGDKTHADQLAASSPQLLALYEQVRAHILAQGDDITEKQLKLYMAYRRLRNFICVILFPKQDPQVRLWLKLDPSTVRLVDGFSYDVTNKSHWGTGDLEVRIKDEETLTLAKPLIERAYQEN